MEEYTKANRSIELSTRVVTTDSFIAEATEIWGETYDYSKVNYINNSHRVVLICPIHGEFEVYAREHLDGRGCPKCLKGKKFIEKLKERFGDKFGLDNFVYIDSQTPVELICPTHGPFRRTPTQILYSSQGCPECREEQQRITREDTHTNKSVVLNNILQINATEINDYKALKAQALKLETRDLEQLIKSLKYELQSRTKLQSISEVRREYKCYRSHQSSCDSFVSIDFETLYPQRVSACSIGMVKYKDGNIVDKYYSLIRPPFDYPGKKGYALTHIHGFTEDNLINEKTFEELLPEIELFVEDLPLVAHNSCVEKNCIRDAVDYYGIRTSLKYNEILDTLPLSHIVEEKLNIEEKGAGTHTLDNVCRRFGVKELPHHNALCDAEMCGNLMLVFHKILTNEVIELPPIQNIIEDIKEITENPNSNIVQNDIFANRNIVLTGFTNSEKQLYHSLIEKLGGIKRTTVSCNTDILITGRNAGPEKMRKALDLNIKIMPESELKEIIQSML